MWRGACCVRCAQLFLASGGSGFCAVRRISVTGNETTVTTVAGSSCGFAEGALNSTSFGTLTGIAVLTMGPNMTRVWVSDSSNHIVWHVNLATNFSTVVAGEGSNIHECPCLECGLSVGPLSMRDAMFLSPSAIDAGLPGSPGIAVGGPARISPLFTPTGLAATPWGAVYILSSGSRQLVVLRDRFLQVVAGSGECPP